VPNRIDGARKPVSNNQLIERSPRPAAVHSPKANRLWLFGHGGLTSGGGCCDNSSPAQSLYRRLERITAQGCVAATRGLGTNWAHRPGDRWCFL